MPERPLIFVDTKGLPVEAASGKETRSVVAALRGGEESKAEGVGKGGWQTMERDGKTGSIRRTGVVRQALFIHRLTRHDQGTALLQGWSLVLNALRGQPKHER